MCCFWLFKNILGKKKVIAGYVPHEFVTRSAAAAAIAGLIVGYTDVVTDIFAASVYYRSNQTDYFILALMFNLIPMCISIGLQENFFSRFLAATQLLAVRETYRSLVLKQETPMLGSLKLLESVVEACPSSLLQLYILLQAWLDGTSGLLPSTSDSVILFSIFSSLCSTSLTLVYALQTDAERSSAPLSACCALPERLLGFKFLEILFFLHHVSELMCRLTAVCALFLAYHQYALIGLTLSLLARFFLASRYNSLPQLATTGNVGGNVVKLLCRGIFALVSDSVWASNIPLTAWLTALTTLEVVIYFSLLFSSPRGKSYSKPDRMQALLAVSVAAWACKMVLYLSRMWIATVIKSSEGPAVPTPSEKGAVIDVHTDGTSIELTSCTAAALPTLPAQHDVETGSPSEKVVSPFSTLQKAASTNAGDKSASFNSAISPSTVSVKTNLTPSDNTPTTSKPSNSLDLGTIESSSLMQYFQGLTV